MNPVNILSEAERVHRDKVTNNCVDGKCIGCGDCCSGFLPLSKREITRIQNYIEEYGIRFIDHSEGFPLLHLPKDMICPFLDLTKPTGYRCNIYPVRPKICKQFKCDKPISSIEKNRDFLIKKNKPVFVREIFKEG